MKNEYLAELLTQIKDYHHWVFTGNFEEADRIWKSIEILVEQVKSADRSL